ncbi:DUF2798 domain-containing protein [Acinetobacter shaoyimingii]|uniref:DUF2798 domain-containing protein n=1 Tax=Acinetobacter shaoyimingii TaxID=2715164 RepID=A0A6G8RZD2_9GAMM|nr:DUF2798 domain-containing protein [Acinetobacter shaoyimingii]NHB59312.1 DUF2798 domain-containing protein [Acinetobacter shaoyimingii]QIO07231.1 DUF2798 domain-containing protein [Acinetobacter shaoyimingii]
MVESKAKIIGNIDKLSAKNAAWVMPLILSCFMSGMISMVNMLLNVGFIEHFWTKWWSAWMLSWAIAYPIVLIALPVVRRLTAVFVNMPK